jgi:hypothetical protein
MRYKSFCGRVYKVSSHTFRETFMNQDDQTTPQASYSAGAMKRMLATPIFLFGGLAAELARSLDCNLLHRSATGQPVRRQQAPS